MANIMTLKDLKNKPSRNGFDLSEKNAFTAKVGELLPVMTQEVMPGDKFKINIEWFTRTQPLNTAAFTRVREYYDVFFVPFDQIWRNFPTFYTNMVNNSTKANSLSTGVRVTDKCPFMTTETICNYLNKVAEADKGTPGSANNFLGYNRGNLTVKLLEYLGYGDYEKYLSTDYKFSSDPMFNVKVTPFALMAYQKIYQDFYRDQQWEDSSPWTYNLDFINSGQEDMTTAIANMPFASNTTNFFDLRYCNWNKDYFMGLLPNSQYGAVATLNVLTQDWQALVLDNYLTYSGVSGSDAQIKRTTGTIANLADAQNNAAKFTIRVPDVKKFVESAVNEVSVIALRQAEYLQKWKEIAQSGGQDYKHQIEKHYGVNVSEALTDHVVYLGGVADNLDISEVVNQNITADNAADIAGKGIGVGRGYIDFDCEKYGNRPGIIMAIYHAVPLLDYATDGIQRLHTKVNQGDFAIPEFDKIGMTQTPVYELSNNYELYDDITNGGLITDPMLDLGYAPRYVDMKTNYDKIRGEFKRTLASWVAPISTNYIIEYFTKYRTTSNLPALYTFNFLKVNPNIMDTIFAVNADGTTATDTFLINSAFDVKVVRNLDRDGLPY